jgi:hypothetical protein
MCCNFRQEGGNKGSLIGEAQFREWEMVASSVYEMEEIEKMLVKQQL